jgi:hypothetical protein
VWWPGRRIAGRALSSSRLECRRRRMPSFPPLPVSGRDWGWGDASRRDRRCPHQQQRSQRLRHRSRSPLPRAAAPFQARHERLRVWVDQAPGPCLSRRVPAAEAACPAGKGMMAVRRLPGASAAVTFGCEHGGGDGISSDIGEASSCLGKSKGGEFTPDLPVAGGCLVRVVEGRLPGCEPRFGAPRTSVQVMNEALPISL